MNNGAFVRNPEGSSSLERPKRKRKDKVKIYRRETVLGEMDWINLAQDRGQWRALRNIEINLGAP
jgi:hypothetical protein